MSSAAAPAKRTAKKATATTTTTVAAPAPVVASTPAPVPVAAPVNTISHAETASATSASSAVEDVNIVAQFNVLVEQVNTLRSTLGSVFSNMKKLEKQIPRELKRASKGRRRGAAKADADPASPKKETVFTKPTAISDALCTFLGVPKGTLISRSEVTTRVCRYAKEKSLMVKQVIKADAPLRKLLALTEADELKILNLQRYLKPHYLKPAPTA